MSEVVVPEYRVRLFLSVDLTGSTFFKSKTDSFTWLKVFQEFYSEFPRNFAANYQEQCDENRHLGEADAQLPPKIWKTIGDEILFVNRVSSIAQLGGYVSAFSKTLHDFGHSMQSQYDLNTKGNGWLAAFPSPNCSIKVQNVGGSDPLSGNSELSSEAFEADVDSNPENYDFLGTGIDSGFRISRNSTIDTFTISPALACLLVRAKINRDTTGFGCDFVFHEPQRFKGVVGNKPYPVVSIDTVRSQEERNLKKIEAELLKQPHTVAETDQLRDYLEKYIELHRIEMPALKLAGGLAEETPPNHYEAYVKSWQAELSKARSDLASLQETGDEDCVSEENLVPSADEVAVDLNVNKANET